MHISKYFAQDRTRRQALARKLGMSAGYLTQVATGWNGRQASPALAQRIEAATGGAVTRSDLRPDIWPPGTQMPAANDDVLPAEGNGAGGEGG